MLLGQLWDYDKLSANDRVGTFFLKFDDIQTRRMEPTWVNVYGMFIVVPVQYSIAFFVLPCMCLTPVWSWLHPLGLDPNLL